jgi:hypothetical protein
VKNDTAATSLKFHSAGDAVGCSQVSGVLTRSTHHLMNLFHSVVSV